MRQVTDKQGDVDIKLIHSVTEFSRDFRDSAEQRLAVIIAGDKDFAGSIRSLRADGF